MYIHVPDLTRLNNKYTLFILLFEHVCIHSRNKILAIVYLGGLKAIINIAQKVILTEHNVNEVNKGRTAHTLYKCISNTRTFV